MPIILTEQEGLQKDGLDTLDGLEYVQAKLKR